MWYAIDFQGNNITTVYIPKGILNWIVTRITYSIRFPKEKYLRTRKLTDSEFQNEWENYVSIS